MSLLFRGSIGVVLSWLLTSLATAQDVRTHGLALGADGKPTVTIIVECVFSQIPLHGYAPVRVTVDNRSSSDAEWRIMFEGHADDDQLQSQFEIEAKKSASTTAELMVPMPSLLGGSSHSFEQELEYSIKAKGFPPEVGTFSNALPVHWPGIAISRDLSVRNAGPLDSQVESQIGSSVDSFAATFELESLPSNWRGYSGLDVVILIDSEWQSLQTKSPAVCQALLEWNRLGGRLDIYSQQGLQPEAIGIHDVKNGRRTLAELGTYQWNGHEFDPGEMVTRYKSARHLRNELNDSSGATQELIEKLGERSFGNWQVAFILIAFGFIVGPVNLFVFAKQGKRHRLFWTTPLISLIASVLLVLLIFLQDGTGGKGERFILINVEPDETNAYVTQYQSARTGVLFSGAFEGKDVFVSQTVLSESPWAAIDTEGDLPKRYNLKDNVYSGDWFQSRREHGHFLKAVRSTRGRIELASTPGSAPTIVSNFGFPLSRMFYLDDGGNTWMSPGEVTTGHRTELEKVEPGTEISIYPKVITTAQIDLEELSLPGHFVAVAENVPDLAIETLSSIEWKDNAVLFGPIAGEGR